MERPSWAPEGIDLDRPSAARMWDYYLGGSHNFAVDRAAAAKAIAAIPDISVVAQANRAFLRQAVRFSVETGVRQFLDIGSGIPTLGNVHEVAQKAAPDARVVYVDIDPVAVAHSRAILAGNDKAAAIQEDLRNAEAILKHPDLRAVLNLDEPITLLLAAILHFVPDSDDPAGILATYKDAMAPGSYMVISHGSAEGRPEVEGDLFSIYRKLVGTTLTSRTRAELTTLFEPFELVEPGIVWVPQWRPELPNAFEEAPERSGHYAAVGRKP
jgi:SAM-dependent methyltransferase